MGDGDGVCWWGVPPLYECQIGMISKLILLLIESWLINSLRNKIKTSRVRNYYAYIKLIQRTTYHPIYQIYVKHAVFVVVFLSSRPTFLLQNQNDRSSAYHTQSHHDLIDLESRKKIFPLCSFNKIEITNICVYLFFYFEIINYQLYYILSYCLFIVYAMIIYNSHNYSLLCLFFFVCSKETHLRCGRKQSPIEQFET